jgi:hypothetical protein
MRLPARAGRLLVQWISVLFTKPPMRGRFVSPPVHARSFALVDQNGLPRQRISRSLFVDVPWFSLLFAASEEKPRDVFRIGSLRAPQRRIA